MKRYLFLRYVTLQVVSLYELEIVIPKITEMLQNGVSSPYYSGSHAILSC